MQLNVSERSAIIGTQLCSSSTHVKEKAKMYSGAFRQLNYPLTEEVPVFIINLTI